MKKRKYLHLGTYMMKAIVSEQMIVNRMKFICFQCAMKVRPFSHSCLQILSCQQMAEQKGH